MQEKELAIKRETIIKKKKKSINRTQRGVKK